MEKLRSQPSAKMLKIKELVDASGGLPVVVFSNYKQFIMRVRTQLITKPNDYAVELFTGELNLQERKAIISRFQRGEIRVLLCTLG